MERGKLLYEGRDKKVFAAASGYVIVSYLPKQRIVGTKINVGMLNHCMTNLFMQLLEKQGIPTHYVEQRSAYDTVVRKVQMIPLKVIVRNVVAGSLSTRVGLPEGTRLKSTILEYRYKDDALGDPMINQFHAYALELCTPEELAAIEDYAFRVNVLLKEYMRKLDLLLTDFKLEFGRLADGTILLADEISLKTCRLWDERTGARLDKDALLHLPCNTADQQIEVINRLINGIESKFLLK